MGCAQKLESGKEVVRRSHKSESAYRKSPYITMHWANRFQTTVYATMQPPKLVVPKPSVSMGVEGSGSGSVALDVVVKSDAKKFIVVYVVRGLSTLRT
jgi:hypothetical protein